MSVTRRRRRHKAVICLTGAALLLGSAGLARAGSPSRPARSLSGTVSVVAAGLDNPRGLSYSKGQIVVALAGVGGRDCPKGAVSPEGGQTCAGLTGAIVALKDGKRHTLVGRLFSSSGVPGGVAASGVADVQPYAHGLRVVFAESVVGALADLPDGSSFSGADDRALRATAGRLATLRGHQLRIGADVGDADYAWSAVHRNLVPDQFPDANPNGLAIDGETTYVADAATNTIDSVDKSGVVRQLVFLPNPPASDAVPTCVALGKDHRLYVGELAPGAARGAGKIYRYDLTKRKLSVWKTGLNTVEGCGFDAKGNFYATEFQAHGFNPGPNGDPSGDVVRFDHKTGKRTVLGAGKLFYPIGFTSDPAGNVYVSNWSILPGTAAHPGMPTGQVVKIHV